MLRQPSFIKSHTVIKYAVFGLLYPLLPLNNVGLVVANIVLLEPSTFVKTTSTGPLANASVNEIECTIYISSGCLPPSIIRIPPLANDVIRRSIALTASS